MIADVGPRPTRAHCLAARLAAARSAHAICGRVRRTLGTRGRQSDVSEENQSVTSPTSPKWGRACSPMCNFASKTIPKGCLAWTNRS